MKRRFILAAIIACLLFHPVFAAKGSSGINYKVTEYIIDSSINKDGSMDVTETITYDFRDKANGVYRDIDLINPDIYEEKLKYKASPYNSAEGIENIEIAEVNLKDGSTIVYKEGEGQNGMTGIYTVDKSTGGASINIYSPADHEVKKFIIKYRLKDVVVKYNDTAELFWTFVGDRWDMELQNIQITLRLPESAGGDIKLFSHGPLEGSAGIVDGRTVSYQTRSKITGETIELRVLFPTSIVPEGKKIVQKDMMEEIMEEEAARAEEANRKRLMGRLSSTALLIWIVLSIALFIVLYIKYGKVPSVDIDESEIKTPPGDLSPALVSHIVQPGLVPSVSITAEIVTLAKKGYITLEQSVEEKEGAPVKKKKPKCRMIRNMRDSQVPITNYQRFMMEWFFDRIGYGRSVTFDEIAKYAQSNRKSFHADMSRWKGMIESKAESMGIKKEKTPSGKISLVFFIISIIVGLAASIYMGAWFFMGIVSILSLILLIICSQFRKLSHRGAVERAKWIAYIKYLKRICKGMEEDIHSLSRWEELFPYAIAFNFSKSAAKHIAETFSDESFKDPNLTFFYSKEYMWPRYKIADFSRSVDSMISGFSSVSGTGGGSSSSGGGGGGGGGGAF